MELIAFFLSFKRNNMNMFLFYTEDSNYFAGIVCLIVAIYQIRSLVLKSDNIPQIVRKLKYIAVCQLVLTFLVVVCVLAPMAGGVEGYKYMLLENSMLYQHLLCPIIAFVSFIYFERESKLPKNSSLIAVIPTIIYAIIMVLLNIFKVIEGPYQFLMVYKQSVLVSIIWFIVIIGAIFLISKVIYCISNKLIEKKGNK